MHKSNTDRRYRADDELQQHLVKPRFTDSEFAAVESEAAMQHGGKLASLVREATLIGIQVMRERREALLKQLQAGGGMDSMNPGDLEAVLAALASQHIAANRSVAQRDTA